MKKSRGKAWGNALGGYKTQRRASNGRFGSGTGAKAKKVAKKAATRTKTAAKAGGVKRRTIKASEQQYKVDKKVVGRRPAKKAHRARKSAAKKQYRKSNPLNKRNVALAAGAVAVAGVALNAYETKNLRNEVNALGGQWTTTNVNGVEFTTLRDVVRTDFDLEMSSLGLVERGVKERNPFLVARGATTAIRPRLRAQIQETTFIHEGPELIGYMSSSVRGRRVHADAVYLGEGHRGNRRVVAAMSKHAKGSQGRHVSKGRKIVVSKYRSEDSERIVRNQARQFGANNIKVQKRYNPPNSDYVQNIIKNMDANFKIKRQNFREDWHPNSKRYVAGRRVKA